MSTERVGNLGRTGSNRRWERQEGGGRDSQNKGCMTHAELSQVGLLGLGLSFPQELLCRLQFFAVVFKGGHWLPPSMPSAFPGASGTSSEFVTVTL